MPAFQIQTAGYGLRINITVLPPSIMETTSAKNKNS